MSQKRLNSLLVIAVAAVAIAFGLNSTATSPKPVHREGFDVALAARTPAAPAPSGDDVAQQGEASGSIARGDAPSLARPSRPDWRRMVEYLRDHSTSNRMSLVNYFVNANVAYRTDMEMLGVENDWATPSQTWARGWGDCEDIATAKYKLAQDAGVAGGLKIAYVLMADLEGNSWLPHMVLFWYEHEGDRDPWVLDLTNSVVRLSARIDLRVKNTFNENGIWLQDRDIVEPNLPRALSLWPSVRDAMYPTKKTESRRASMLPKSGSRGGRSQKLVGGYYM